MRTVYCAVVVAVLAVALGLTRGALAAVPDVPIAYRAPASCPAEEGFVQRLRSRLGLSQAPARLGRTVDVQIALAEGRYVGKLTLVGADGRSTTKTLDDASCEELVDALSLVAALALETDDVEGTARAPAPTPAPAPAPARESASTPAPAPARESAPAPGAPSRIGVALGGLAAIGPAPRPLLGAALALHWTQPGAGLFTPTLELGGAASLSPEAPEAKGTASFAWLSARAAAYVVQWPPGAGVAFRAGVVGDFGVVVAHGRDTTSPATSSRPWASPGGIVGAEVPLGSRFAIQIAAALEAPLRRDLYAFGSTDFFHVPAVVGTASASLVAYVR